MELSGEQRQHYASQGYLLLPRFLCDVSELEGALSELLKDCSEGYITEEDGRTPRSIYCSHLKTGALAEMARDSRLLRPAQQLLGDDLYIYQLKVNFKRAYTGGAWSWHQDFIYWKNEDQLPSAALINAVVFLDDVGSDSGPIQLIPGSHAGGVLPVLPFVQSTSDPRQREVVTGESYTLGDAQVEALRQAGGQVSAEGPMGSLLYFHPNLVHGSSSNRSNRDRRLLLVTYCDVRNRPMRTRSRFLVGRDYRSLQAQVTVS